MNILNLPVELISIICNNLKDIHFINFISTCKYLNQPQLLKLIKFHEPYNIMMIHNILNKYVFTTLHINNSLHIEKIPNSVKNIVFGSSYQSSIDNLPDHIEEIFIKGDFNRAINKLPKNLKRLKL